MTRAHAVWVIYASLATALLVINLVVFAMELNLCAARYLREDEMRRWKKVLSDDEAKIVLRIFEGKTADDDGGGLGGGGGGRGSDEEEALDAVDRDKRSEKVLKQFIVDDRDIVVDEKIGSDQFGSIFRCTFLSTFLHASLGQRGPPVS